MIRVRDLCARNLIGGLVRGVPPGVAVAAAFLAIAGGAVSAGEEGGLLAVIEEGETIEAAARHTQSLSDAPACVTVITRREMDEFGYETIGEAIASAAGYYLIDDLNYSRLGVRGFAPFGDYGSHVLVMIDGHPMIEPIFASSFFDRNQPIDVAHVQQIEIVRGPGSALYGTNAVLGVVNIITTRATESAPVAVGAAGRTNRGGEASLSLGTVRKSGLQAKVSGTVTTNDGFDYYFKEFDDPSSNFGKAEGMDRERTWGAQGQLKHYGWTLSGLVSGRTKHLPTASWDAPFGDSRLRTRDNLGFVDSRYDATIGVAHLTAQLTYDWYSYKGVWPSLDGDETLVIEDPHTSKVLGGEVVVSTEAIDRNYLVAGCSVKRTLNATLRAYVTEPEYFESVDIERTETVLSAFVQDEITLRPRAVTAILGARYDHYQSFGGVLKPRVGLVVKSRAGATKLLYGTSFRAPSLYERYYQDQEVGCDPGYAHANPDLEPEDAYTYEVVHDADIGRSTHATVSAFYYKLLNQITERELDGGCISYRNSGTSRSKGVEAEVRGEMGPGLRWAVAYAITDARDKETGDRLPVSPSNLGSVRLSVPLARYGASLGLAVQYFGSRLTRNGSELEPTVVTNATLRIKRIVSRLSLAVTARNLFNAEHLEPAGPEMLQEAVPQGERVFVIRVGWDL